MAFYEQKVRQFWIAYHRYLVERRRLFGPDERPKHAPDEHERRVQAAMEKYDAELEKLAQDGVRDARRINGEYEADPSKEQHAWIRSRAALEFVEIVNGARDRLRNPGEQET